MLDSATKLFSPLLVPILALVVGACGDDGGGSAADAGDQVDADDSDATPATGTCGIVVDPRLGTFVVTGTSKPSLDGHTVVFSNSDGSLIDTATTDATGAASIDDCTRDTIVTAVIPRELRYGAGPEGGDVVIGANILVPVVTGNFAVTYTHVQPGDTVYYGGGPRQEFVADQVVSMNVSVPAEAGFAAGDRFILTNGCSRTNGYTTEEPSVVELSVYQSCRQADGTVNVHATLVDDQSNSDKGLAYTFSKDITVAGDGSTTVTLPAWTEGDTTFAGTAASFAAGSAYAGMEVRQQIDAISYASVIASTCCSGPLPPSISNTSFGTGPEFGARVYQHSYMYSSTDVLSGSPSSQITRMTDFTQNSLIDMSEALPYLQGVVLSLPEAGRPALNWLAAGSLDEGQMVVAELLVEVPQDDAPTIYNEWLIVTPDAGAGTVQAPALPETTLAEVFPATAGVDPEAKGLFILATDFSSYQQLITSEGFQPEVPQRIPFPDAGTATLRRTGAGSIDD